MNEYNHNDIESKWQKKWTEDGTYRTDTNSTKPKHYVLDMFPYPSGAALHVGHPKGYIATDVYSRFHRMNGFEVLHPMGWDAFGLPAEQYAIKNKIHPRIAVSQNIQRFKDQLSMIGFDHDWGREVNTTDPDYYHWTQWAFVQMMKKGLAFQSHEPINWCPSCKTGLANEDLESDGTCERCGSQVEKRPLRQWVLRITDYADRLVDDLDSLPDWPDHVKEAQRNWIGRSYGAEIDFPIKDTPGALKVFTTRPDTLFGATYMVVAPEHPMIHQLHDRIENIDEVKTYIEVASQKTEIDRTDMTREKSGVELKGVTAINPANNEEIPVWVADYVSGDYGTGAIMAVPAHDERDFAFAKKYGIEIRQVVSGDFDGLQAVVAHGVLLNSGSFDGVDSSDAKEKITKHVGGTMKTSYKLRDWVFSRQRYWGEPIPVVHVPAGAPKVSLNFRQQPIWDRIVSGHKTIETRVLNPEEPERFFGDVSAGDVVEFVNKNTRETLKVQVAQVWQFSTLDEYLANAEVLEGTYAPKPIPQSVQEIEEGYAALSPGYAEKMTANGLVAWKFELLDGMAAYPVDESQLPVALPEVESYEPVDTGESPLAGIDDWVNVSGYVTDTGTFMVADTAPDGRELVQARRETNTMPQWAGSNWYYLRYLDPGNSEALIDPMIEKNWMPVDLYVGGMEHATRHLIYARFWHKFLFDIGAISSEEPFTKLITVGLVQAEDGRKMSKRWGNVVNPDDMIERFGADAFRTYEMFMGPFENAIPWSTDGLVGTRRFIEKVWRVAGRSIQAGNGTTSEAGQRLLHKTIKKVARDIKAFRHNTAVSQMMILVNAWDKEDAVSTDDLGVFLQILAPFAPHMTEELWQQLGQEGSIHTSAWPQHDEALVIDEVVTIPVQINGKVRAQLEIAADAAETDVLAAAKALAELEPWLENKTIVKEIYVPGRIINVVVSDK